MATTKIWKVEHHQFRVLQYIYNPDKTDGALYPQHANAEATELSQIGISSSETEQCLFVSGINCGDEPYIVFEEMKMTKQQFGKTGGILAFHCEQAFAPGETTPEQAHEIGVKLAQEMWGERFEVLVATHLDKAHLHNHFVVNSVSFKDGLRYYDNKTTYRQIRSISDRLCKECRLSVIEDPNGRGKQYTEWKAEQQGQPTWRSLIRADVDEAVAVSMTFTQFISHLENKGYEIKTGVKYMAVKPPGKPRFARLYNLGVGYSETEIKQRILQNKTHKTIVVSVRVKRYQLRGSCQQLNPINGFRASYLFYLYKMGVLPKGKASNNRVPFLLRESLIKLKSLSAEAQLLATTKIDTAEQLDIYRQTHQSRCDVLVSDRKNIYNKIRRCKPEQKEGYQANIKELSKQIAQCRKTVNLCKNIAARSVEIQQTLKTVREQELQQRKEKQADERSVRRSR